MNDLKESFANMQGLEWVSWFVLKPIAVILTVITFIILQELKMDIWNENFIVKIAIKLEAESEDEAIEELENKLDEGKVNLNRMEFFVESIT